MWWRWRRRKRKRRRRGWSPRMGGHRAVRFFRARRDDRIQHGRPRARAASANLVSPHSAIKSLACAARTTAANYSAVLRRWRRLDRDPRRSHRAGRRALPAHAGGAIAMVERHDGFYALFADGELRGPVSPGSAGRFADSERRRRSTTRAASQLVDYAADAGARRSAAVANWSPRCASTTTARRRSSSIARAPRL